MTAAWILAAMPMLGQDSAAQDQRSGVSRPDATVMTTSPDTADTEPQPQAKPSAAIAATPATSTSQTIYGPYVPYRSAGSQTRASDAKAFDPDATIVTEATAGQSDRRLLSTSEDAVDGKDEGMVTYVPSRRGEIPEGTIVKVKLREELSTLTTRPGTKFTAEVTESVMRDGRVIIPVGSMLEGRVTWLRGGKRIGGSAAIHMEPRTVTLPDGAQYVLRARVIDTSSWQNTKVDNEGTITRRENAKKEAAAIGLSTGGGMAAGAILGGLPGAVIGAGVGAGVSTVVWLKQDRQAELPKNLGVVFSLTEPMSVTPAGAATSSQNPEAPGGD